MSAILFSATAVAGLSKVFLIVSLYLESNVASEGFAAFHELVAFACDFGQIGRAHV